MLLQKRIRKTNQYKEINKNKALVKGITQIKGYVRVSKCHKWLIDH